MIVWSTLILSLIGISAILYGLIGYNFFDYPFEPTVIVLLTGISVLILSRSASGVKIRNE